MDGRCFMKCDKDIRVHTRCVEVADLSFVASLHKVEKETFLCTSCY